MTDQLTTKVRFVKCPRCHKVLPESENIPVYKCGGCGVVLKAKQRKNDVKDSGSHVNESDTAQKIDLEHASDGKKARSLSHEETLPCTSQSPVDKNCGSDQNEMQGSNGETSGDAKFPGELAMEPTCHGNEELSPAVREETEVEPNSFEQNDGGDQNESGFCNGKQTGGVSFSDEVASSTELNCHDNGEPEPSPIAGAYSEVDFEQTNERSQNEYECCNGKHPGDVQSSDEEVPSSTGLNHRETGLSSPVAGGHSEVDLEQNNLRSQNEYEYCNGKQPEVVNFSNEEVASSTVLNHHETESSSPVAGAHSEVNLEQNNLRSQNEHEYCNGKQPRVVNFSNEEVASSTGLNRHESEESTPAARVDCAVDLVQKHERDQYKFEYCNGKQPGGVYYSDELASANEFKNHGSGESSPLTGFHSEVEENMNCLEQNNGRNQSGYVHCKGEWPGNVKFSNELSLSTELTCQEIEESSPVVGTSTELDEDSTELTCQEIEESSPVVGTSTELDGDSRSRFIFGSLSAENLLAASPRDPFITAQRTTGESILTDNYMPPHSEQLEQPEKLNGFGRVSSVDTLENIALANPSSDFCVTLADMPKSPTTRSYYAYDGSVSSYDGTDDQASDLHLHTSKRKFKGEELANSRAMPRRDEVLNYITDSYPEMQDQAWNSSSISSEKKPYAMKGNYWDQDELLESTRHAHPVRSRMKCDTDERQFMVPFYSRDCLVGSENGSPSYFRRNEFQCSTSSYPTTKPEYLEEEKMELLKMVYELQDQLKKIDISKGKANGRFPGVARMEKKTPLEYNRVVPAVEGCHDLSNTRYPRRCNHERIWPQGSHISRIPFSADATNSRHQVDRSCLHCCPQDWHISAPMHPYVCCNKNQYPAHPNQRCYNLYRSSPSSPRHYTGSEFSVRSCDAKSDDRWRANHHEVKKSSKERHHVVKRHVRPVAGGAPFLICYGCSELLQVPAEFLLFRRRCHQLKCSACSVTLKFSLQNGTHIVQYTDFNPDAVAPPPSEVDECSDATNGRKLVSNTHNGPHADPMSCSDDYGASLPKSGSTDGEPFLAALPLRALQRGSNERKMSSGSSFETIEERKRPIFIESRNKYKNPVETFASAGPSTSKMSTAEKFSSEIEELPERQNSPLHRLLGYSSPMEVIYAEE